jgi:hypothetical protein
MIESGRVWLPKNKRWADDLVTELLQFPNSAHDDQVDALTMAIHYMKESWHLEHPEDPYYEDEPRKKRVAYWRV